MDDQLKDANQRLFDTEKSKQSVDDRIDQLLDGFTEVRKRIQSIADQRNSIRKELEFKQCECQWLTKMHDMSKEKDKLLEEKISKKQKKIRKLKEELQRKESELQAAQQRARTQQAELSDLRTQLKKKHEEMKNLQSENEKLASSCNSAREQVSDLVQLTVTLSSDKRKMEVNVIDLHFGFYALLTCTSPYPPFSNNWLIQKRKQSSNHNELRPALQASVISLQRLKLYHVLSRRKKLQWLSLKENFSHTSRKPMIQKGFWRYSTWRHKLLN